MISPKYDLGLKNTNGIGISGLINIVNVCDTVIGENFPEGVYWLDEDNLYSLRYGIERDEWGVEA